MRPSVHACSSRVPWSACSSRSPRPRCWMRSMLHFQRADDPMPSPVPHTMPIVFVVDDDVSVRESLELLIRFAGWQPETFASAREFLARPRAGVPSCLILDVGLPDLNGLDLQTRLATD